MTTNAIQVEGLTKSFGSARALDGLDLTVTEGEVHGFLGPNGAGKSTTIRVLIGLVRADAGNVRLLGGDPWSDAVALHRQIAYVPGDVTLWPSLTGGETIDLLARMRGGIDEGRRAELIDRFGLDPSKKARTYSKGNRQKVSLVSAFASNARLLLLDEPSSGLDPLMENVFQQCVTEARDRGATVLLSSHILAETEALCQRVTIIRAGRTIETGTLASMRHLSRTSITVWLLVAITVTLFGVLPRFSAVAWGVLVAFIAVYLLGSLSNSPRWLVDLEPFTHIPRVGSDGFSVTPLLWLLAIDVALITLGVMAFRRRDLR
jgi:ABC-2 type transport system ATP-binding protein